MPLNVQISLNPNNPWERLVLRIADTAADEGRSLNNVAALLLPVVPLVEMALARRRLGLAQGGFTVRAGDHQLSLRMPRPTDPMCDGVLYEVEEMRHGRVRRLWEQLNGEAARAQGREAAEEALEAAC